MRKRDRSAAGLKGALIHCRVDTGMQVDDAKPAVKRDQLRVMLGNTVGCQSAATGGAVTND